MRYDFDYFHKNLLVNQNVRYDQYKDKTEFDIFLSQLKAEAIYDLTEIDWSLFVEQIVKMGIESFFQQIGWEQVRFKVLVYLQQHLATLCQGTKLESQVLKLEKECARLISEIINDRTPHSYHGDFCGMPELSFYDYMQSPTLYKEKTPMTQWIEMRQEERRQSYRKSEKTPKSQTFPIAPIDILQSAYKCSIDTTQKVCYPVIYNVQKTLSQWKDYELRIAALEDICEHHVDYLRPLDIPDAVKASFYLECKSLICYNKALAQLMTQKSNRDVVSVNHDMDCMDLDGYIYACSLCDFDIKYFIAYAEGLHLYKSNKEKDFSFQWHMPILQVGNLIGTLYATNCFDFCHHILLAEYERRGRTFQLRKGDVFTYKNFDLNLRNKCFAEYIRLRRLMVKDKMDHDNTLVHTPTESDYLNRLFHIESRVLNQQLDIDKAKDKGIYPTASFEGRTDVVELTKIFIKYLRDYIEHQGITILPDTNDFSYELSVELDLDSDLDKSFFETRTIHSKALKNPDNIAGRYEYENKEGLVFYANDTSNEHHQEVIFPGIYGAIVKLVLDDRFSDAERQYMNQRYMLHHHVDFCLIDQFFEAYLKFESAYYETSEIICDLYHWWKKFSENLQLLDLYYRDLARQITKYLIHYIGVNKSPRPLTPDVLFTEPLADSFTIRWKNLPTPDNLETYGEKYAELKYLLIEKYAIMDRPSPRYVHGFTETLLVLVAENTRDETLRSIQSSYINEEKYPRSYEFADDNPMPIIDRISYLFDERDLVFTFSRFSPDDIYEAHLRRAKQDLPEYFHSHRILRKDYEGDKIYAIIYQNELRIAERLLEHYCIKPLTYKTRCEIVSYLGMFLVYMADVYDVDPGYKQIHKVLTPLLDQLHSEDNSPKLETYDSVLDENGRIDYDKFGANLLANLTEPINICLKPLEDKLGYAIPDDGTSAEDEALAYIKPIFHKIDALLNRNYSPQWVDALLECIQQDSSTAIKFQKAVHKIADRPIYLCMGAMMKEGIFGDNTAPKIVKALMLKPNTVPSSDNVHKYLNDGTATNKFTQKIRDFMKNN